MSMPYTPSYLHPLSQSCVHARHLPVCILFLAANSSTAILFQVDLDRRLNAASDSNILLLMFVKTPPHSNILLLTFIKTPTHNCSHMRSYLIHMRSKTGDIVNFYCQVLYLPHLCNVSIIWFPMVIHTSYLLLLSINTLSFLNTFMGVSLWVYACQMFFTSSAEARPLDSHDCSGKEPPITPGVGLAWLLGWTGPPQH